MSAPVSVRCAPNDSIRATFVAFAPTGTNTRAAIPSSHAAHATAAPWLPVLAATTSRTGARPCWLDSA